MKYVVGIDLGTSSVKCLLVSQKGEIITSASSEHKPDFLENGYVEQNPEIWWNNTKQTIKSLIEKAPQAKNNIAAISVSGQMHSSVFLDKDGNVIRNAILWNDTRTTKQTIEIYEKCGGKENVLLNVYNLALEGFTLPKILWLRENEPDNFKKVSKVIMPKDYINYKLTGIIATEVSDAAGTLLYDVINNKWSDFILDSLELNKDILPNVYESTSIIGNIKNELIEELCLTNDTVIIAGGADNSCAGIGNGVIKKGQAVISVGTSGTVVGYLDEIKSDVNGSVHLFNYSAPKSKYVMGCMLSAGECLNWLQRTYFKNNSFSDMNKLAEKSAVGSNKLIFLPYLCGERSPHNDANARGMFFGLSSSTTQADMIRSVMEGVAFGLKDLFIQVSNFTNINDIYITGGGAKSNIWGQIISDVINQPLNILNISEGPSFGAALIALVGSGLCKDFEQAKGNSVKIERTITPSKNTKEYESIYPIFKELYTANKELYKKLQSI